MTAIALPIVIPGGPAFAELLLARDRGAFDLEMDVSLILEICAASGVADAAAFLAESEENLAMLVIMWYRANLTAGGALDVVAELLQAEVDAEDTLGVTRVQPAPGRLQ